jgi:hypothetical protein
VRTERTERTEKAEENVTLTLTPSVARRRGRGPNLRAF